MLVDSKLLLRMASPKIVDRAVRLLDRSTAYVVSVFWVVSLVTLCLAVYAVHGAVVAKREATRALVAEPILPNISTVPMSMNELVKVADKLQRQFPEIKITATDNKGAVIRLRCDDGALFHQWITALSYIDTTAPQYRWTIREFCTGECQGGMGLMSATVWGQKVVIMKPKEG